MKQPPMGDAESTKTVETRNRSDISIELNKRPGTKYICQRSLVTSTDLRCVHPMYPTMFIRAALCFLLCALSTVVRRSAESLLQLFCCCCCCRNCNQSGSHDYLLIILGDSIDSALPRPRVCMYVGVSRSQQTDYFLTCSAT